MVSQVRVRDMAGEILALGRDLAARCSDGRWTIRRSYRQPMGSGENC
jgi:hypothetical protein